MIKQSDLALAAWKATERTLDAVVTINKIDYKTTDIASISYDAGGYTGDTFGIGSNYENSVTIKFAHLIEGLKPGMTVWPKIGIKTSNGYEYSSLGLFIVSDDIQMDRNNDETTIKAYDQMCLLEGTYTSKLTYPAKMTSVIAEIANLAGVLLNTTDISRLPVQVNLPSAITGQTYRNAIGMIAQFYAGFATFDRDGKLTIRTITEPDYTLDPSQYEQGGLTKNEAPYKIGGIQCEVTTTTTDSTGQSTETTNTLQVGATSGSQIKLTNNLMTMDRLTSIWQQLQSLTFYPFSLNWFGNPAIEAGDWLTLQDTKGNKFNVPNNGYTMTFDGSLSAVSKADQTSTSSSSYAWRGELSQYVADLGGRQGASGNYIYGTDTTEPPYGAKFNDIWYKQNGNKVELWTYERQADGTGKWVLTVSDATGEEVKAKVDQVELEAKASTDAAKAASDKADQLAAKYDDINALTNQALGQAVSAEGEASSAVATAKSTASDFGKVDQKADSAVASALNAQSSASSAIDKANSTASDFGKVSQKTDSAVATALNAQSNANDAVKQASSAAADSKDAKQIAGAVSQSYKTLTDGSTMTITELESGLAVKLTKNDLDGYATQTWTQNQIQVSADGITGTVSSIKSTVDGQTTSINDLKADSSSFKSQFTTVNNTLGKQTTDIGSLKATSKELSSGFNTLTSDNKTNKNDISRLKQTATEVSSTLETVQTQVQNSAVGTNLIQMSNTTAGYVSGDNGTISPVDSTLERVTDFIKVESNQTYCMQEEIHLLTGQFLWFGVGVYDGNKTFIKRLEGSEIPVTANGAAFQKWTIVIPDNAKYVRVSFVTYGDENARFKFEKGSVATDYSVNPADTATVTAVSSISQTIDGMKSDISKKIEQKDLNGYATQTWSQNKINATADGINATVSSVKTTVNGHTTSINELKADSSGFKSQFTKVNDTLGKQSTDIGTLQATSKSLSASFDSLSSDNKTNKHNISQLQASATEFSSTLTTVQKQVKNSATVTALSNVDQKVDSISSTVAKNKSNADSKFTNINQTVDGIKSIAVNKADKTEVSQIKQTANNIKLSVNELYTEHTNLVKNSGFVNGEYWSNGADKVWYSISNGVPIAAGTYIGGSADRDNWSFIQTPSDDIVASLKGKTVIFSVYARTNEAEGQFRIYIKTTDSDGNGTYFGTNKIYTRDSTDWKRYSITVDIPEDAVQMNLTINFLNLNKISCYASGAMLNLGSSLLPYNEGHGDIVNLINVDSSGILISGKKIMIDGDTYIKNGVIKSAMIANLSADKLTAGTINAANINVINFNANNITTGTINGSNLSINLNTGNVEFQEGRIHNSSNTIDINVNEGYMSVANGSNRVMLKNGEMQFVEPGTYDTSTDPYLRISNTFGGQSTEGAAFIGRKYAVLTNSDNATGSGIFDIVMGTEKFSGIATGYGSGLLNKGWHMTKVGGAERGVVISGGKATSYNQYWSASPSIMVGATQTSNSSGGMNGSNIIMDCDYLYNFSTWVRTSSHAANVYVADDGAIVRASSASKYKTNIERSFDINMGERILEIPTAHWFDKAEVRKKALDPQAPDPRRYFGMIADDLDDAGLTELVEYNEKGEVEGIMYDRVALTLIPIVRNYRDRINELELEVKQLKEG
ncbi:gp58-like family protein [Lactiplantibacillus pentosus]|uniref:gp58-like family protein n=1 Tax=Lactiplantibacillus pentosus TaxID=1589 RepID=UPI0020A798BB|nr:gp58-like family protein [Lactiplantibacillus pentosus]MDT7035407.1 gp58-like family protein [Lactiplantibacillus pentosus]